MTPTMQPESPEVMASIQDKADKIAEFERQIAELKRQSDKLPHKYTFEECRTFGCKHTKGRQIHCTLENTCIHSRWAHGAHRDFYEKMPEKLPDNTVYPTYGWKTVARNGRFIYNVIKETPKTIVYMDGGFTGTLFKSTAFQIEDVTFMKDRSGAVTFCADGGAEAIEMALALLKIHSEERHAKVVMNIQEIKEMFGD